MWGREEWAIEPLLPSGPFPDADECPVPEVVRLYKVHNHPHVAVTSLRDRGAVEQGTVVVYQPPRSPAVWGAKYTTALDAMKSIRGCNVHWRPLSMYWPGDALSPELTAFYAQALGRVVQSPHSDLAWLEPHRDCCVPTAANVTSSDPSPQEEGATNMAVLSHGSPTLKGAICGTVPAAEIIGGAPAPHPSVRPHGTRCGCLHHRGASAQGT